MLNNPNTYFSELLFFLLTHTKFLLCPEIVADAETKKEQPFDCSFVRMTGLEPTRLSTLDPKSSAATSYATSARWWSVFLISECKDSKKYSITNIFGKKIFFYFLFILFIAVSIKLLRFKRGAFAHFHRELVLLCLRPR